MLDSTDKTHGKAGHLCSSLCGAAMIRQAEDRRIFDDRGQPRQGRDALSAENAWRRAVWLVEYPPEREVIERLERRNVEAKLKDLEAAKAEDQRDVAAATPDPDGPGCEYCGGGMAHWPECPVVAR